jgi:hypothetical protein
MCAQSKERRIGGNIWPDDPVREEYMDYIVLGSVCSVSVKFKCRDKSTFRETRENSFDRTKTFC